MTLSNRRLTRGIVRASLALGALGAEIPPSLSVGTLALIPNARMAIPYVITTWLDAEGSKVATSSL